MQLDRRGQAVVMGLVTILMTGLLSVVISQFQRVYEHQNRIYKIKSMQGLMEERLRGILLHPANYVNCKPIANGMDCDINPSTLVKMKQVQVPGTACNDKKSKCGVEVDGPIGLPVINGALATKDFQFMITYTGTDVAIKPKSVTIRVPLNLTLSVNADCGLIDPTKPFLKSVNADGTLNCAAAATCPVGTYMTGFGTSDSPSCATFGTSAIACADLNQMIGQLNWEGGSDYTKSCVNRVNPFTLFGDPTSWSSTPSAPPVINGACGVADGKNLAAAPPATDLCNMGTASALSGSGPWTWTCAGSGGGITANCTATATVELCWSMDESFSIEWDPARCSSGNVGPCVTEGEWKSGGKCANRATNVMEYVGGAIGTLHSECRPKSEGKCNGEAVGGGCDPTGSFYTWNGINWDDFGSPTWSPPIGMSTPPPAGPMQYPAQYGDNVALDMTKRLICLPGPLACGSAHGVAGPPNVANLCNYTGVYPAINPVVNGSGPWTWTCGTALCSAPSAAPGCSVATVGPTYILYSAVTGALCSGSAPADTFCKADTDAGKVARCIDGGICDASGCSDGFQYTCSCGAPPVTLCGGVPEPAADGGPTTCGYEDRSPAWQGFTRKCDGGYWICSGTWTWEPPLCVKNGGTPNIFEDCP